MTAKTWLKFVGSAQALRGLKTRFRKAKAIHEQDFAEGFGEVYLPYAL